MASLKVKLGILAAGLMLSGCMQATTYEATNTNNFKPRDKELLAKTTYAKVAVAEPFRRAIVDYHRKEAPGSIVVDSDNHFSISSRRTARRSATALPSARKPWQRSGIAGRQQDRVAGWHPTPGEISRLGVPDLRGPGPDNPMGSRALYLSGGEDTCSAFMAPTSPEYIARRFPRAASA
jgi:lipoprotein-anchoring transpeptidase ErfK/SrfK